MSFSVGDNVVGPPLTSLHGNVVWIPEPSGFDAMCRVKGPVGSFLKSRAEATQQLAKDLAPVDTGELRDSISVSYGKWEEGIYADIFTDVFYGPFQELGTSRNPPHPYLRPALMAMFQDTLDSGKATRFTSTWSGEYVGTEGRFEWDSEGRDWEEF